MVAKWMQFFPTYLVPQITELTRDRLQPVRRIAENCNHLRKKGLSNFFESPMFIGRDGEI